MISRQPFAIVALAYLAGATVAASGTLLGIRDDLARRYAHAQILRDLHPGQRRVIFARDPQGGRGVAPFVALLCPLRWGKTEAYLRWAIYTCQTKRRASCIYVSMHRSSAKEIAWPKLEELFEHYKIRVKKNNVDLAIKFLETDSRLRLVGADHPRYARLIRGTEHDGVGVDEIQEFRHVDVQYLIESVIMPRVADRRGRVFIFGTPGPEEAGYFYDVVWRQGLPYWAIVLGDLYENPHNVEQLRAQIERFKLANPMIESEPWFQREWRGRWVVDNRNLMVPIDGALNYLTEWQPAHDDIYVLGIDWGYSPAPSAYVIGCVNPRLYEYLVYLEAWERGEMRLRDHIAAIRDFQQRYPGLTVVADPAGSAKTVIEELRYEHNIPIRNARKLHKDWHVDKMASDASLGLLKLHNLADPKRPEQHPLAQEWARLAWRIDRETGARIEGSPRHRHDAAMYVRRAVSLALHRPSDPPADTFTRARMESMRSTSYVQ